MTCECILTQKRSKMRKAILVIIMFSLVLSATLFAEDSTTTTVTIASVVEAPIKENPAIIISFVTPELSTKVTSSTSATTTPEEEASVVTGLNLTESGSLTFSLMTSEEITVTTNSTKLNLSIEIVADGFHLYDDSSVSEGSLLDDSKIKQRNAVPLASNTPEIQIPQFYGQNENVAVNHVAGNKNTVEVQFNKGTTKANLVLGTFDVAWEGKRPLDAGIYKAKVSVVYSTP